MVDTVVLNAFSSLVRQIQITPDVVKFQIKGFEIKPTVSFEKKAYLKKKDWNSCKQDELHSETHFYWLFSQLHSFGYTAGILNDPEQNCSFEAAARFELTISCLLDRRFNQLSHAAFHGTRIFPIKFS